MSDSATSKPSVRARTNRSDQVDLLDSSKKTSSVAPAKTFAPPSHNSRSKLNISRSVIFNLVFFSFLVFAVPLTVFFYGLDTWFQGNPTYAGIAAALSANAVVLLFVVVAFSEDGGDDEGDAQKNPQLRGRKHNDNNDSKSNGHKDDGSSTSSVFLSKRAQAAPVVANSSMSIELRHAVDDAVKQILEDDYGFVEDHTISNTQLTLGYTSSVAIIIGSIYGFLVPFEQSKPLLFVCMAIYAVMSTAMSAYNILVRKDNLYVGNSKDATGASPDTHIVIRSTFEKYSDVYRLTLAVSKSKNAKSQNKSQSPSSGSVIEKSYGAWFDVNGELVPKRIHDDISKALGSDLLHKS
ncbi:hypothetical protein BASA50_006193 [Batrachochytrium salamandrivorans]|uniref:Signal peptidase complex subunit 2 n=1 Tax=Batrachochytrium salamandrivorans TaxID=1357716 RepID=A0ABQ8FAK8_9FUNG|nr:hypothetical protein BASA50_006193 [Batrachochytrium salamandrivorans]